MKQKKLEEKLIEKGKLVESEMEEEEEEKDEREAESEEEGEEEGNGGNRGSGSADGSSSSSGGSVQLEEDDDESEEDELERRAGGKAVEAGRSSSPDYSGRSTKPAVVDDGLEEVRHHNSDSPILASTTASLELSRGFSDLLVHS